MILYRISLEIILPDSVAAQQPIPLLYHALLSKHPPTSHGGENQNHKKPSKISDHNITPFKISNKWKHTHQDTHIEKPCSLQQDLIVILYTNLQPFKSNGFYIYDYEKKPSEMMWR